VIGGTPVRDALDSALVALNAAGVDSPRLDAELLLAHALGVDRARLIIDREGLVVAGGAAREFQTLVRRRAIDREPVAYLLGPRASGTSPWTWTRGCSSPGRRRSCSWRVGLGCRRMPRSWTSGPARARSRSP
jgi:methylase of polypeptide subunit release factors